MIARLWCRRAQLPWAADRWAADVWAVVRRWPTCCLALLALVVALPSPALAQNPRYHEFYRADVPPGTIGAGQLMRGGPLPGYFQPVEISAPPDTHVTIATEGTFEAPQPAPLRAALLVGRVYRLKVTNIPFHPGQEVYPSVELINRLYPPPGAEAKFPVPIELTREELEMALRGQYVVRVVYLEDPQAALPVRDDPQQQRYFEVGPRQDPLQVADAMGRPIAILRLGSRVPDLDPSSGRFLFDSPPWMQLPAWEEPPAPLAPDQVPAAPGTEPTPAAPPSAEPAPANPPEAAPTITQRSPAAAGGSR